MIRYGNILTLITAALGATAPAATIPPRAVLQTPVPFYRAFHPSVHDHFYTTDGAELLNAVQLYRYSAEGEACRIYEAQVSGTVSFYRLYSPSRGDHLYTTSAAERDSALQDAVYRDPSVAGYIYPTDSTDRLVEVVPLFRLYSQDALDHFYTVSAMERDATIGQFGYYDEGISGYVFPPE
ncbi:hypothetical protein BJY04DRAFT_222504 [Aspergillus karnatakaensis]|uniref:uncharacterized protein n=1 Tax=Aspergillus karnatakaensis TaxID=1810916 RepID=UPI003CCE254F